MNTQDAARPGRHYRRPVERPFTRAERDRVTLLFGSLSVAHDRLLTAAIRGLGYHAEAIPTPRRRDLQTGRELCNSGQCNPVYFVAGALINHLERRRSERGLDRDEVADRYVFVTPGSCGPCRFGMYEAQYRQALAKAGYPGFRVIAFDKKGGGDGHPDEGYGDGLAVDLGLYIAVLDALFMADVLNATFYRARPYATDAAAADRTFETCLTECEQALGRPRPDPRVTVTARLLAAVTPLPSAADAARLLARLRDRTCTDALARCRRIIEEGFEVDYLRPRPLIKITGEFWAQTTEGDGNFRMFEFLEAEGAEIQVEPVAGWVDYMRYGLHGQLEEARAAEDPPAGARSGQALLRVATTRVRHWLIKQTGRLLHREYDRMRAALRDCPAPLADQRTLERLGRPYYHPRITGGEGHLEVAKTLYYHRHRLAHMTLSLKPFGCMPSTQSDGAQAAVQADDPDIRFLPIETSGEGEINAYSRAQMALGEARESARSEFRDALARSGHDLATLRAYIAERPQLRSPLYPIPQSDAAISRAARFVHHLAERMPTRAEGPRPAGTEGKQREIRHVDPR
ncbi:activator of (R)-2-hydroxyglutaryl-CoA dehydratase [Halorhodospira halophila]|nr:activator of (R)-2-hydroxyglutaryl-CoA dehydratase [Halorhodospira halophila]